MLQLQLKKYYEKENKLIESVTIHKIKIEENSDVNSIVMQNVASQETGRKRKVAEVKIPNLK